ncbi:PVC-type heme-binding CxxCH protein [Tundrisphaera sp. TA3]|uniref:PVC-type heme-binding CxxCH protein n=1 Tax=Tundrisphaera sp. TA3 TaxID=3435775 RepID=UPI003EBAC4C7
MRSWARMACLTFALGTGTAGPALADDFPEPRDTEPTPGGPAMSAEQAAKAFKVPDGFHVSVFASEPDVRNPIGMAWDPRGRLWIAENYTYAERAQRFAPDQRDRVVIFEDSDNDGRHDKRTVFYDKLKALTSVEVGRGGTWLMCPPQLLFIPDKDGDDRPDGEPEVILDGFTIPQDNYHNFANGLRWGPDGWLYGRVGASSPGRVGAPGTPDAERVPINGGLWRYNPTSKQFQMIAHGTTNPWGHDWDANGEAYFINTVNGHLWHAIPGAHFHRLHTVDPNPRVYTTIDQHADHYHWDNRKEWQDSRKVEGEHDRLGGGHAHTGLMIYQGDQWPADSRGKAFMLNFHGRRTNVDRLERLGGGVVGRHEPDRFQSGDPWFRPIDLGQGPDGSVFVLDWSDTGECHDSSGVHRSSGRIYKITHGTPKPPIGDLTKLDVKALADLLRHPNVWYARMATDQIVDRLERAVAKFPRPERGPNFRAQFHLNRANEAAELARISQEGGFRALLDESTDPTIRLRALWTLDRLRLIARYESASSPRSLNYVGLLRDRDEVIRAWAIRLLTNSMPIDDVMSRPWTRVDDVARVWDAQRKALVRMAAEDPSALVRLTLASTLQRFPVAHRAELAAPLLARKEDAEDHDIPLMLWYGLIPLADADPSAVAELGAKCVLPTTRRLIARRLSEDLEKNPGPLNLLLGKLTESGDAGARSDAAMGIAEGLRGWRKAPRPEAWPAFSAKLAEVVGGDRDRARELDVVFGDGRALDEIRRVALDDKADLTARKSALRSLIEARPDDLRAVCERLLKVRFLNPVAASGLTLFDDPAVAKALAASYKAFHPSERPQFVDAMASRPAFARVLLDQVAEGKIPRTDISVAHARQIRALGDAEVARKLGEVWGEMREATADKKATIARFKSKLTPEVLAAADRSRGRSVFSKTCGACHALFGQGGDLGPDLTGSGRENLDYVLENVIDPGAAVTADFRMTIVATKDGRTLTGLARDPTPKTITLRNQDASLVLPREEIEHIETSPLSFMPEGQLDALPEDEARDLVAYLMGRTQVPLPK